MNIRIGFLTIEARQCFSLVTVLCLLAVSFPATGIAQNIGATPDPENSQCLKYINPSSGVCAPGPCQAFKNGAYVAGHCTTCYICQADTVTSISGQTILVGLGIVSAILNLGKQLFGPGTGVTGNSLNPYTSTNPYGQATCTGTRFISTVPTTNPCGVYIPTTSTTNPNINLSPIGGGTATVGTSGPAMATLSVVPASGPAPLSVTFTVIDTSTSCAHAAVSISAGDGTPSATAIPATSSCAGRTPQILTYTYRTAGTYSATITDQSTQEVLQTVTVTVTSGTTTAGAASASLSVFPTSGAAPLAVTFTVTDTSTACSHAAITLSAGDGTAPVTAIPTTISCTGRTPQVFTYSYRTAGSYTAAITDQSTGQVLQSVPVTVTGTTTPDDDMTNATLTVVPASGSAPLKVTFTITDTSTACPRSEIALSAGDGSAPVTALPATVTCIGITPAVLNYTYRNAGTFTAFIGNASNKQVLKGVVITVTPGNANTTQPPLTAPLTTPTASTVNVSSSLLNLANSGNTAVAAPRTVQSGTWGDIQANASGVTITAGAHDKDGRTGVGGFYGYDAVPGIQPQDLAKQMCAARPWGNSSATAIIPPSFYDSICTARGYKVGVAAPASSAGTGAASKSSAPPSATKTPSKTATSTGPKGPTAVTVPPKVYITAVPSSVKLGSRTSIFWNAVGVKACLITSPD